MSKANRLLKKYPSPEVGVISGELAFRFIDTYGVPLELVILKAQEARLFIDWPTFHKTATASNWSIGRIDAARKLANRYYSRDWVETNFNLTRHNDKRG